MGLLERIFGDPTAKAVKKMEAKADQVLALDGEMAKLSDESLQAKTQEFKERLANGETLDDLLVEAFAVCREAAHRSLGMKHFKVQIVGGIALHEGNIAEMKTGEGKTLVATLPAYLNALEGKGVHVVTVNDYLAKRDAEWMGKIYEFLGLTVGCVVHGITDKERKAAYRADITYGTNNEYGFDYLRDNMVTYESNLTQRPLNFAIIDEVDSILIDEARTPLIISGQGQKSSEMYMLADRFVKGLKIENDFTVEEKDRKVALTEEGINKAEKFFKISNFGDPENMEINHHVMEALKARNIMQRDVDYIVKDGEIVIVDEFTGRLMFGRRYSNGLHQAIEAKEGVLVRSESRTLATITLQNYFRMYQKLAGMTGTAKTEEEEFRDIYNMQVMVIPTNKEIKRQDLDDQIYATTEVKYKALADKIAEVHRTGQPILVGTISIENSEKISNLLKKRGVKHNILNAKQHDKEAEIVAEAGRLGAVTIATNMAGRGTDIILGGNPEFEAKQELKREGFTEEEISYATALVKTNEPGFLRARRRYEEHLAQFMQQRKAEHEQVLALGGLCIIGTERHESRRIDNQLRGRAGRQGDPGVTQFFISMEDDLMRRHGGEFIQNVMGKAGMDDQALAAGVLSKSVERTQKAVESKYYEIRKHVLQYDNVMNRQREIIYEERKKVLHGDDLKENILGMMEDLVDNIVKPATMDSKFAEEWDFNAINENLKRISPRFPGLQYKEEEITDLTAEQVEADAKAIFRDMYEAKEAEVGAELLREVERMIMLRVVDNRWMDHIQAMEDLKDGIGLRSLGQIDPKVAYSNEGFAMFEEMTGDIREETVRYCYAATVETSTERKSVTGPGVGNKEDFQKTALRLLRRPKKADDSGVPKEAPKPEAPKKQETVRREEAKVGRNDACPCGSGKKYKNCCMGKNPEQ